MVHRMRGGYRNEIGVAGHPRVSLDGPDDKVVSLKEARLWLVVGDIVASYAFESHKGS